MSPFRTGEEANARERERGREALSFFCFPVRQSIDLALRQACQKKEETLSKPKLTRVPYPKTNDPQVLKWVKSRCVRTGVLGDIRGLREGAREKK